MVFGLRIRFFIGEFEFLSANLRSIFEIDVDFKYFEVCYYHVSILLLYRALSCTGDFGMVVYGDQGACFVVFDNTTDMIHCR